MTRAYRQREREIIDTIKEGVIILGVVVFISFLLYFRVGFLKVATVMLFLVTLYFLLRDREESIWVQRLFVITLIWATPLVGVPIGLGLIATRLLFTAFLWGYIFIAILGYLNAPVPLYVLQVAATAITLIRMRTSLPTSLWLLSGTNLLLAMDVWPQFVKQYVAINMYVYFAIEQPQLSHLAYQLYLRYFILNFDKFTVASLAYQLAFIVPIAVYETFREITKRPALASAIFTFSYAWFTLPIVIVGGREALPYAVELQVMAQDAWFYVYAKTIALLAGLRLIVMNDPVSAVGALVSHITGPVYLLLSLGIRILYKRKLDVKTVAATALAPAITFLSTSNSLLTTAGALVPLLYFLSYRYGYKAELIIHKFPDIRIPLLTIFIYTTFAYSLYRWEYVDLYYRSFALGEYPPLPAFVIPTGIIGLLAILRSKSEDQVALILALTASYALFGVGYYLGTAIGGLRFLGYLTFITTLIVINRYNRILLPLALLAFSNATLYADGWWLNGHKVHGIAEACSGICVTDNWNYWSQLLISRGTAVKSIDLFSSAYPLGPIAVLKSYGNSTLQTFPLRHGNSYLHLAPPIDLSQVATPAITADIAVLGDELDMIIDMYNRGITVAVVAPGDLYAHAGRVVIGKSKIIRAEQCPANVVLPHSAWTHVNITATGFIEIELWKGKLRITDNVILYRDNLIHQIPRKESTVSVIYNKTWTINGQIVPLRDKLYYALIKCANGTLHIEAHRTLPRAIQASPRSFPIVAPLKRMSASPLEDFRQPKTISNIEAKGVVIKALSGILEEADGKVRVEPLSDVEILAEYATVLDGAYTYPRVYIENGQINGEKVRYAYLLLRYPNITATYMSFIADGIPLEGNNLVCNFVIWDGVTYCWDLYFTKDNKNLVRTKPTVNPLYEELSILGKAAPLLLLSFLLALLIYMSDAALTQRFQDFD